MNGNILKNKIYIDYTTGRFIVIFGDYIYNYKGEVILSNNEKIKNFLLNNPTYKSLDYYDLDDLLDALSENLDRYKILDENKFFRLGRLICVKNGNTISLGIITLIKEIKDENKSEIKYIEVITEYGEKLMLNKDQISENVYNVTGMEDMMIDSIIEILNFYNLEEYLSVNLEEFLN